jgi:hypothetical protein
VKQAEERNLKAESEKEELDAFYKETLKEDLDQDLAVLDKERQEALEEEEWLKAEIESMDLEERTLQIESDEFRAQSATLQASNQIDQNTT